jgi:hypothetical protein
MSRLLEVYMVVNFRAREISRGVYKLTRTLMLIIIKKFIEHYLFKGNNEHN